MMTAKMPPEKTVVIGQTKVAYYEQGTGETVLLLHGWPQTSYVWRKVFPELAKRYHVVALDLPGLGNSGTPLSYDTKNIATIVNEFAEHLGAEKFHLVGHDVGAWVAAAYALHFGNRLRTVTIMDAGIPGVMPAEVFQPENSAKIWQFYFHAVEELPEFLIQGKEKEYLAWYFSKKSYIKTAIIEKDLKVYYKAYKGKEKMKSGFDYYRAFSESASQNKAVASSIKIPVLAVGGQYAMANQVGVAMQKIATNVKSESIGSCGHYLPEEQPQKVVELIDEHIQSNISR